MAYTAFSVITGEVLTSTKMNLIGTNEDGLRDGTNNAWGSSAVLTGGPAQTTYTPTLTNVTLGTGGTATAKHHQIGKRDFVTLSIVLGTGGTWSGDISVSLPVTAVAYSGTQNVTPLGLVEFYDLSAPGLNLGVVSMATTTTVVLRPINSAGTYDAVTPASGSIPFTPAAGDEIGASFSFVAA